MRERDSSRLSSHVTPGLLEGRQYAQVPLLMVPLSYEPFLVSARDRDAAELPRISRRGAQPRINIVLHLDHTPIGNASSLTHRPLPLLPIHLS